MRGRSRRKKLTGKVYSLQKRFLAFMLAFAMIFTSVGTDLQVSFAASGNQVDFTIGGSDLVDAIRQAIENDSPVSEDSLDFTDGAVEKFDALFFGDGKVYEVYPDIQGDSMEAELRVFVKLPADADDMYMVTGEEEVYFLYVNNGEDTISCSTTITRTENGKEKEKTTKRIAVKSYEDKFGEEERNIISKPAEPTQVGNASEEKSLDTVAEEPTGNVVNPTDEEKETTTTEETAENQENKGDAEESPDQAEESKAEETPKETEADETEATVETEIDVEAEPETEAQEQEPDQEGEITASISRHGVPLVAMKEEDTEATETAEPTEPEKEVAAAAETPEAFEDIPETDEETTVEETAEEITTEETTTEAAEPETETAQEIKTEGPAGQETTKAQAETETKVPAGPGETAVSEETTASEETAEVAEAETEPTQPAQTTPATQEALPTPTAEAVLQPEEPTKTAETAGDGDLVGIGYCSTAKVYKSTLNALKALNDIDGYAVTYAIDPENSAKIIDGALAVKEGESLTFGVKNRLGYAVDQVTVNDEEIEPVSAAENEDGSQTIWYTVTDVNTELDIFVYMREEVQTIAFAMLLDLYEDETVTVTRIKMDSAATDTVEIPVGEIADNAPALDGYEFAYAKVDNTLVKQVAKDGDTGKIYVTTEDNELSGIEIEDSSDICLYYKPLVKRYTVTYIQVVDETKVTSEFPAQIEGVTQVEEGGDLEFAFTLKKGYKATAVYAGDTKLEADADGIYKVSKVQADVEIRIELKKITEYTLVFHGSNTKFVYGNSYKTSNQGDEHGYNWNTKYTVGKEIKFQLNAHYEWTGAPKVLNKLKLTIDGADEGSISIPTLEGTKNAETTLLSNNIKVTVTKLSNKDKNKPEYSVVITSTEDIHGNIDVETNFKDQAVSEIWAQELIGIEPLPYYRSDKGYVSGYNGEDQNSALDPKKFTFDTRDTEKDTYIFVKVKAGYSDELADITLKVIEDGSVNNSYKLSKIPETGSQNGFASARTNGCKYYFVISKDKDGYKPKDIRIYLTAKAADQIFDIIYEYDNGTDTSTKKADYELNQPFAVTDGKEYPTKEGYVFQGWEFNDTVYKPGSMFKIDAATKELTKYNKTTKHYELTFKAKWVEADQADKALYKINVFFENENYEYNETEPDISFSEYGPKGRKAFIIKSSLNSKLNEFDNLPENWTTEYELDTDKTKTFSVEVKEDGSASINIYYCHKQYDYQVIRYFENATGSITGQETLKAGKGKLNQNILQISSVDAGKTGDVKLYNGKNYTWLKVDGENLAITADGENIVCIYYSLDEKGNTVADDPIIPDLPDGIPDKYQTVFKYRSADTDAGIVTGTVYEVHTFKENGEYVEASERPVSPEVKVTVSPKNENAFDYWTIDGTVKDHSVGMNQLKAATYTRDTTFTAYFKIKDDLHYEIHYFYEGANGVVTEDTAAKVVKEDGVFGEKILTGTVAAEADFNGKHYALDHIDGADKRITLIAADNIVNIYYSLDEIGEPDPEKPDQIPDKYQIMFRYISENPSYGTISGIIKEVVTRPKNADGTYNMTAQVNPKADVTVTGIGNYRFNHWSDGTTNYSAASEIAKAGFTADTTFTAYFSYSGGNNGGGGNGGGGSSSGGGGGGSHRATISSTSGGPGVTATITPGDVPMAEIPETPAPIIIDDGDIPMAALPKTGQTAVKAALTMMLSGIFLAITAIGRKKKEQDA